jgi:hypothetical protein
MIGDIVGFRVRGHHLFAFFKSRPYYERFSILFKAREQFAADFKRRRSVRCAFFHVLKRQGELTDILERQWHCILLPSSSSCDAWRFKGELLSGTPLRASARAT